MLAAAEALVADDLLQPDRLALRVGHLEADDALPGNRGLDADLQRLQRHRQIIGELGDRRDSHAGGRLELEHGDDRAGANLGDPAFDLIGLQRPKQPVRLLMEEVGRDLHDVAVYVVEEAERGQLVLARAHRRGQRNLELGRPVVVQARSDERLESGADGGRREADVLERRQRV